MPDPGGALDVSRETAERLQILEGLLRKWTKAINLVSAASLEDFRSRHILDSAQIFALRGTSFGRWVDLGSGGGLPGAVIAIMAHDQAPGITVTCVESDQRKAAFLRTVSRETDVPFDVISQRAESIAPLAADIVSARALASLDVLLQHARRHLAPGGIALFPKGATHRKERDAAEKNWRFDAEVFTSQTDPNAVIYKVGALSRV